MRKTGKLIVSVTAVCISVFAQQGPSNSPAADLFLGKWTLNVGKSSPGPTSGTITIEPQKKQYKITLELAYEVSGGVSWTVTDMKG